ncbi:6900_t:CDS:2 [Rhizophagus irregularis]|nr:6900_t:CDS:2 [Rhizophagus irregularis]
MEVEFKHSDFIPAHTTSSSIDDSELEQRLDESGKKFYVKVLQGLSTDFANFVNELLSHQNGKNGLIRCYGITQDPATKDYALVIRCIERDMKSYLYSSLPYPEYDWKTKLEILADIASVLHRIHDAGFVHKNLHTGNLRRLMNSTIVTEINLNSHAEEVYIWVQWWLDLCNDSTSDIAAEFNIVDGERKQKDGNFFTHPEAIYTKRFLDFPSLPEPENFSPDTYHQMVSLYARRQHILDSDSHWSANNNSDIFDFESQLSRPPSTYAENNKDNQILTPPPHKIIRDISLEYNIPGAFIGDNIEIIDNWDGKYNYLLYLTII